MIAPAGPDAIAAITTGQRLSFMMQGAMMAIAAGTTAMIARNWGNKQYIQAGKLTGLAIKLSLMAGTLAALLVWISAPAIARLFLHEPQAIEQTVTFLRTFAPWLIALALNLVLSTALRACGEVLIPLYSALILAAVNIPLVFAWTQGAWGMPYLGVTGVAWASGIGLLASSVFILLMIVRKSSPVQLNFSLSTFGDQAQKMLSIGWPAAVEQIILHGGLNIFVLIIGQYGTAAYSAYGVGVSILALSFLVGFGFSLASATLVGQKLGASDRRAAFHYGWQSMWLAVFCMTIMGFLVILTAPLIGQLLALTEDVIRLTLLFIYFLGLMQPLMAIEFSLSGALRGAGDTRSPLFITMLALTVRLILAMIVLWLEAPVVWVFACLLADYCIKGVLYIRRFRSLSWLRAYNP